jgi:hypothetical protein
LAGERLGTEVSRAKRLVFSFACSLADALAAFGLEGAT